MTLSRHDVTSDLADPRCDVHWKPAEFVIVVDRPGAERVLACDGCVGERMREALLADPFVPPTVHAVDIDRHRGWAA